MRRFALSLVVAAGACVPEGNSTPSEAGASANAVAAPTFRPSMNIMNAPFEDNFERSSKPVPPLMPLASASAGASAGASATPAGSAPGVFASATPALSILPPNMPIPDDLGPNWHQAQTAAWRIENGRLCGAHAQNHGVWLTRVLPVNARIEFDAIADSPEGDLKAEIWGDGQSHATAMSYTNATSYLAILGGWKNKFHVLARINEHGNDRKQISVDPQSDDPKEKPVVVGQSYHFKVERADGKTVRWAVNGLDYLSYEDPAPLAGIGHDHFGFNDWDVKVCFDNVKVTPLP